MSIVRNDALFTSGKEHRTEKEPLDAAKKAEAAPTVAVENVSLNIAARLGGAVIGTEMTLAADDDDTPRSAPDSGIR